MAKKPTTRHIIETQGPRMDKANVTVSSYTLNAPQPTGNNLKSKLEWYIGVALKVQGFVIACEMCTRHARIQDANGVTTEMAEMMKQLFGVKTLRNLLEPETRVTFSERIMNVQSIALDALQARQRGDVDETGLLCLKLGEAWACAVASIAGPYVRQVADKAKDLREKALDSERDAAERHKPIARTFHKLRAQHPQKTKEKIKELTAQEYKVSIPTVERAVKKYPATKE